MRGRDHGNRAKKRSIKELALGILTGYRHTQDQTTGVMGARNVAEERVVTIGEYPDPEMWSATFSMRAEPWPSRTPARNVMLCPGRTTAPSGGPAKVTCSGLCIAISSRYGPSRRESRS